MLTLGQQIIGKQVLSLRIGRPIGIVGEPIINPNNLKIEGWHATDSSTKQNAILLSQDIREIIDQGFIVNDHEALSQTDDLIRLKQILDYRFTLINKAVYSGRKRLGKVNDYAFERNGFFVQKLYVGQSIVKSFTGGNLVIDRTQIVEITNKKIAVKEATVQDTAPLPVTA